MRGTGYNVQEANSYEQPQCEDLETRIARTKGELDEFTHHMKSLEDFVDSMTFRQVVDSYEHRIYLYATTELLRQCVNTEHRRYEELLVRLEARDK